MKKLLTLALSLSALLSFGQTWVDVGGGMDNQVGALHSFNDTLYAGGLFHLAGSTGASHMASWNGTSWADMGGGMDVSSMARVSSIIDFNGKIVAGGGFNNASANYVGNIAEFDGLLWQDMDSGVALGTPFTGVSDLEVFNGDLYACGVFTVAGGNPAKYIARWDGSNWTSLGTGLNNIAWGMTVHNGLLYVGGEFDTAGGLPTAGIAAWNGATWGPVAGSINGPVQDLESFGGMLYAIGGFTKIDAFTLNYIGAFDGTNWIPLGSGLNTMGTCLYADTINGYLYLGGDFTSANSVTTPRIARYDGTTFEALGSGMDNGVWAIMKHDGFIYAGGAFTLADGNPATYIARWTEVIVDPPVLLSSSPANGDTGVMLNAAIELTFSSPMDQSNFNYNTTPDPTNWNISWNATSDVATLTHTDFAPLTTYTFRITQAQDTLGNLLVAGSAPLPFTFTTGNSTSIHSPHLVHAELFPNPTTGVISVRPSGQLTIHDLLGRQVYRKEVNRYANVSHLPAGVYIATLKNGTKVTRKRLVITD